VSEGTITLGKSASVSPGKAAGLQVAGKGKSEVRKATPRRAAVAPVGQDSVKPGRDKARVTTLAG
jgi:hypothetical protein